MRNYCRIYGCQSVVNGRGLCNLHYKRWKTTGSALGTKRPGPAPKQLVERFWPKVDVRGSDECWPWTGGKSGEYGDIWVNELQESIGAHIVSVFLATGLWPTSFICHSCDNPPCVNPAHLFEGSAGDNSRDMAAKGRWANQHRDKTHCKHGHELVGENVRIDSKGTRHCRACAKRRQVEFRERRTLA